MKAVDAGSVTSSLTSITSSILRGHVEGGRTYAAYGKEGWQALFVSSNDDNDDEDDDIDKFIADSCPCHPEYGMPIDDLELDRIDMCHAKYYALLGKKRFLAPIGDNPHKILDLGCGTGMASSLASC